MSLPNNYVCEGQMSIFDLGIWCGKTSLELLAPTTEKISERSLKRPQKWQKGMPAFLDLRGGQKWPTAGCIMGDGWSIAWRVHDAQFWGVPQRRKRIALVADFGGDTAPEILFERQGVSGNLETCREQREEITKAAGGGFEETISFQERAGKPGGGKGILIQNERTGALSTLNNQSVCTNYKANGADGKGVAFATVGDHESRPTDMTNLVIEPQTYQKTTGALMASGYDKLGTQEAANDMYVVQSNWDGSQVAPTLTSNNAGGGQRMPDKDNFNAVLSYGLDRAAYNQGQNAKFGFSVDKEKVGAQTAMGPGAVCTSIVRRLTPMECERLQGYPDHWTDIGEWVDTKGKKHKDADSPRYKALGNSIALPFWQWMAGRMVKHIPHPASMASLFDGIGGFPLVFSRCGCKPVWASEIEEFPIAVTKMRFKTD